MKTFLAQKHNSFIATICKLSVPLFLRRNQLEVRVSQECLNEIKRLGRSNAVILFNHSDRFDPLVVAELSRKAQEDFGYIASREQFDGFQGLQGWLMQRCGAYSVLRGEPEDNQSKEATVSYICNSSHKLVEFPEGDVTGRDDVVLPLKEDGIRNILEAQQRILMKGEKEAVFLLPVAIYYEVQKDGVKAMEDCLTQLENCFGLIQTKLSIAMRVQRLVSALILNLEDVYAIKSFGSRLDQRLLSLCAQVASSIARINGLPVERVTQLDSFVLERVLIDLKPECAAEQVMIYLH